MNGCDVPRKAVDSLGDGSISSEYNKSENVLYVCRGMDRELLFSSLYREMASIEMKDVQDSELKSFRCYCISYMLCKRYGISVDNFDFSELPQEITSKVETKEIRQELEKMRNNYEKYINPKLNYLKEFLKLETLTDNERMMIKDHIQSLEFIINIIMIDF